ncbi:MAG: AI-2E family transporter [Saprospiraceae bacterium]|nr:AI-2E family transporter [Saprospiraceae bacterium]
MNKPVNLIEGRVIRQFIFLAVILSVLVFVAIQLHFLIVPCLAALTFYVLLRNLMFRLVEKYKWKKWLAALSLMLLTLVIIVVPLFWLFNFGYAKIISVIENPDTIKTSFANITHYINAQFGINVIDTEYVAKLNHFLLDIAQKTIGSTINTIGAFGMMYLILYFMLYQYEDVENWVRNKLPLRNVNSNKLIRKTQALIISNALGIPVVAIVQGLGGHAGILDIWSGGIYAFRIIDRHREHSAGSRICHSVCALEFVSAFAGIYRQWSRSRALGCVYHWHLRQCGTICPAEVYE